MDLTGKGVLVTGAAKRVGRALALDLAGAGARVVVHYRQSAEAAAATVDEIVAAGGWARALAADLTVPADIERLAEEAHATLAGAFDIAIASAAVFRRTPWAEVSEDDWDFHLQANLKSTFLLARAVAPRLRDGGCLVTFGDWSALRPMPGYLPYCVSKAGVVALTQGLALELAPRLRVNCVCPGTVLPPEQADEAALARLRDVPPLRRIGEPADVVAAVRFLVAGSDFTTGTILTVDGGRLVANSGLY